MKTFDNELRKVRDDGAYKEIKAITDKIDGIVNIKEFDTVGDGIVDDSNKIRNMLTKLGTKNITIHIDRPYLINSNLTFNKNINLHFLQGGRFIIQSGVTFTINGTIEAGLYQIFSGNGIIAGNPKLSCVYPEWFGAVSDGATDDGSAIQKSLDMVKNANVEKVFFSGDVYYCNQTLTIYPYTYLEGSGAHRTIISAGDSVVNLFEAKSANYTSTTAQFIMKRIQLTGNNAQRGIYVMAGKNLRIEECWFQGFLKEQLFLDQCFDSTIEKTYFFNAPNTGSEPLVRLFYGSTDNVNEIQFDHCVFETFARVAVRIESGSGGANHVNEIMFDNCKWESIYVTNHVEIFGAYNIFFSNFDFCISKNTGTATSPTNYGVLIDGSKWVQFVNGNVEWFRSVNGAAEPPFIGLQNSSSVINVNNVGMFPTTSDLVPIWDIDGSSSYIQTFGTYCGSTPYRKLTNTPSLNYVTKTLNVESENSETYLSLYRNDIAKRFYIGRIDATGRFRIMEGETERLAIHPTTKRLIPIAGIDLDSAYDGAKVLMMGTNRIWIDSKGVTRIKNGTPTTETDGEVLGVKLRASISSAPDYIGQISVVSGTAYIATGTSGAADWKQISN